MPESIRSMVVKIVIKDPRQLKGIKTSLEDARLLSGSRDKISRKDGEIEILTNTNDSRTVEAKLPGVSYRLEQVEVTEHPQTFDQMVRQLLQGAPEDEIERLMQKVPKKWTIYKPMVLFKSGTFDDPVWTKYLSPSFWELLKQTGFFENVTHFAVNKPIIESDVMRRPFNILPLYGDFGPLSSFEAPSDQDFRSAFWCQITQNGIIQTWSPKYTMFSRGNIKEKARILQNYNINPGDWGCDLYAGIGYFTLLYLTRGMRMFCWEINPWSIEGLVRGLQLNKFKYRVVEHQQEYTKQQFSQDENEGIQAVIFKESNEYSLHRLQELDPAILHINLGLLPSSKPSWQYSAKIRKTSPGYIHIHENVHTTDVDRLKDEIESFFHPGSVQHVEKVKTFAPDVWHIVFDLLTQ